MPHTQRPMIHQSTYPNPSRHTQSHTHTQTQTINKATRTQTIKLIKANNSHHTHHLSHLSETHATDLKSKPLKIPKKTPSSISKCHHHHAFVGPYFGQQQVREWERVDEKTETKTKTKPKLKQHHRNKPNKKKNHHWSHHRSYLRLTKPIHPPIQTHQSTDSNPPATDPNPPIQTQHANPRQSNLQNPKPNTSASFEWERCERGSEKGRAVTCERQREEVRIRMREDSWENKILFLVLQLCYSVILNVELHFSSIAKKFAILTFYKSACEGFLDLYTKFCLHMKDGIPIVNLLWMLL